MSDMKRLLSSAYMCGYSDARNDKAIDPISTIERLTMNLNKIDLISRQDAIKCCRNEWEEEVEERLRLLPSAEPEIIRCKDCKHYYYTDNRVFGERTWVCDVLNFEDLDEDEFCARAERRTEWRK